MGRLIMDRLKRNLTVEYPHKFVTKTVLAK